MTGRIAQAWDPRATYPGIGVVGEDEWGPVRRASWSIGPYDIVNAVIRATNGRDYVVPVHWGITRDANGAKVSARVFNARVNALGDGPYADDAGFKRCIVPVNGFYLWCGAVPCYVYAADGRPLLVAGLCRKTGAHAMDMTIVTMPAVGRLYLVCDNMPLVVGEGGCADLWLSGKGALGEAADALTGRLDSLAKGWRFHRVAMLHGEGEGNIRAAGPIMPVAFDPKPGLFDDEAGTDWEDWRIQGVPSPREVGKYKNHLTRDRKKAWGLPGSLEEGWAGRLKTQWLDLRDHWLDPDGGVRYPYVPSPEELESVGAPDKRTLERWGVPDSPKGWRRQLQFEWRRLHPDW